MAELLSLSLGGGVVCPRTYALSHCEMNQIVNKRREGAYRQTRFQLTSTDSTRPWVEHDRRDYNIETILLQ